MIKSATQKKKTPGGRRVSNGRGEKERNIPGSSLSATTLLFLWRDEQQQTLQSNTDCRRSPTKQQLIDEREKITQQPNISMESEQKIKVAEVRRAREA